MQTIPDTLCYLNGDYGSLRDAKVSVLDRGFMFGDGIYEVLPAYGGKLFRFPEHMARLDHNLQKIRIVNPHDHDAWLERCRKLLAAPTGHVRPDGSIPDQLVYLPGNPRRRVARPCHARKCSSDRLHDVQRVAAGLGRATPSRRGLHQRTRLSMATRRYQEHVAAA